MKLVGIVLAAGIGLMAFKAGIVLAAIITPAVLMWLAITNPYQFWGHAILFSLIVWANAHPVFGLVTIAMLCAAGLWPRMTHLRCKNSTHLGHGQKDG